MQAYLAPAAFPEVVFALEAVKGLPLAILSNGSPAMLDSAVRSTPGVVFRRDHFRRQGEILQTLSSCLCAGIGDLEPSCRGDLFVSSNLWDAAGAKAFGYPVCWCNRSGVEMEDWGLPPILLCPDWIKSERS